MTEDAQPLTTLTLSTIHVRGRGFHLTKPIRVSAMCEDGVWSFEYEPLGILAYSTSRDDAFSQFCEEFEFVWEEYAREQDKKMTADAQDLKRRALALVARVEDAEDERLPDERTGICAQP